MAEVAFQALAFMQPGYLRHVSFPIDNFCAFQYPQAGQVKNWTPATSAGKKYTHSTLKGQVKMHQGLDTYYVQDIITLLRFL